MRRATVFNGFHGLRSRDFNPRSPWGERLLLSVSVLSSSNFNPRSPWGERLCFSKSVGKSPTISIHALREESDGYLYPIEQYLEDISIHALREESDLFKLLGSQKIKKFQSTLSVRRATELSGKLCFNTWHFNPRSPWGERRKLCNPCQTS